MRRSGPERQDRCFQIGSGNPRHHHLIADHLPRLAPGDGGGQHAAQPCALLSPDQFALSVRQPGQDARILVGIAYLTGELQLLDTRASRRVSSIAKVARSPNSKEAVDRLAALPRLGIADRHPLEISLHSAAALRACQSPSVSGWWFSAPPIHPSFVTSWSSHTQMNAARAWAACMSGSALHLRVAAAVIGQRYRFMRRIG